VVTVDMAIVRIDGEDAAATKKKPGTPGASA
jgi:hypothetical protein